MEEKYRINGETLTAFADQVRRLAETDRELLPAEMIEQLSAVDTELWAYLNQTTLYLNRADSFVQNGTAVEVLYG